MCFEDTRRLFFSFCRWYKACPPQGFNLSASRERGLIRLSDVVPSLYVSVRESKDSCPARSGKRC
jgi:hypothetical protein